MLHLESEGVCTALKGRQRSALCGIVCEETEAPRQRTPPAPIRRHALTAQARCRLARLVHGRERRRLGWRHQGGRRCQRRRRGKRLRGSLRGRRCCRRRSAAVAVQEALSCVLGSSRRWRDKLGGRRRTAGRHRSRDWRWTALWEVVDASAESFGASMHPRFHLCERYLPDAPWPTSR